MSKRESPKSKAGCPICGAEREEAFRPFCSKRCADVDLHRWLSGGYRIPTDEEPEPEDLLAALDPSTGTPH